MNLFLKRQYKKILKDPNVDTKIIRYRGIDVYVGGEVARPGYYTLSGITNNESSSKCSDSVSLDFEEEIPNVNPSTNI